MIVSFFPALLILQAATGGGVSMIGFGVQMVAIFAIFYFLMIRPQQKQRKDTQQMLANLKKGDRVVTRGGIQAVVDKVEEKSLRIEVGNGLKMWMRRDYIDQIVNDGV